MQTILNIFISLGVDQTVFIQFALVVVIYFILKFTFFSKLQEVLDTRENKTTKMESGANKKFTEAEALAAKYRAEIEKTDSEALNIITTKKNDVLAAQKAQVKSTEKALNSEYETKRKELEAEYNSKKNAILSQADSLSNDLVQKILQ